VLSLCNAPEQRFSIEVDSAKAKVISVHQTIRDESTLSA
jgi:hypothetical protein